MVSMMPILIVLIQHINKMLTCLTHSFSVEAKRRKSVFKMAAREAMMDVVTLPYEQI